MSEWNDEKTRGMFGFLVDHYLLGWEDFGLINSRTIHTTANKRHASILQPSPYSFLKNSLNISMLPSNKPVATSDSFFRMVIGRRGH